jgi:hypothetical protein
MSHTFIHFKELVYTTVKDGESKIHRISQQAGDPGKTQGSSRSLAAIISFILRLSTDWTRLTHTVKFNVFYSKSANLNVYLA